MELADGTSQVVTSDDAWKLTTDGPIVANNEYDGEEYDARKEMPDWAAPGFDASAWQPVEKVEGPAGALAAQAMRPIRVVETIRPVSLTQPRPGTFIFDMGQNMVGWCRLRVQGPRGAQVSLRFAETIQPDGSLYLDNIRGAKVTDIYTLKGEGAETYEPRFTYHGFRYVEMRGYPGPGQPDLNAIEGCVVHDDMPSAGTFNCSHPLLNRIYRNIRWGVRGNYRSIPTDCPQRDERQGWLGDRSAESKGETYLFQVAPLYANWVADMEHAQNEAGVVPDVAPSYWPVYSDNVTWPSSFVIIPNSLYEQYGDTRVIGDRYAGMKRWIEHLHTHLKDDIMPRDQYGDWCVPPESQELIHSLDPKRKTAKEILGTTYYYYCLNLMTRYADMLGKDRRRGRVPRPGRTAQDGAQRQVFQQAGNAVRQRLAHLVRAAAGLRHDPAGPT